MIIVPSKDIIRPFLGNGDIDKHSRNRKFPSLQFLGLLFTPVQATATRNLFEEICLSPNRGSLQIERPATPLPVPTLSSSHQSARDGWIMKKIINSKSGDLKPITFFLPHLPQSVP